MQLLKRRLLRAEARQRVMAERDPLTALYNRRSFDAALERAVGRPDGVALVLFDFDAFKAINDEYGHPVGDAVLRAVSSACADVVREGDTLARLGGDEFAVIAPGARSSGVARIVASLEDAIAGADFPSGIPTVRASFAWAVGPADGQSGQAPARPRRPAPALPQATEQAGDLAARYGFVDRSAKLGGSRMRRVVAGLVALTAALVFAQPATAKRPDAGALRRRHLALVRGDDRRPQRAAGGHPRERRGSQRPDVDDEHRRLHVERRGGREARHHPPLRARVAPAPHDRHARGAWSATRRAGQFYNWYDHRTGEKLTVWPPSGEPLDADPLDGRQRLAGGRPEDRRRARARALAPGARALYDAHGLRLLLPAGRQPDAVPLRAATPARRRAATTRSSASRGSAPTSASPRARCPSAFTSASSARSPTLRLELDRDEARRLHAHVLRHHGLRRLAALQRHARHARAGAAACSRR